MNCPATHLRCQHTREADYLNYGCRCPAARADREHRRKTRHLRHPWLIDGTGTRRRLQALMRAGWPSRDLAARLGRGSASLGVLLWGQPKQAQVTSRMHQRVTGLFEQLWDKPGPSPETARRAAAKGWPPPLWWDDDLIDDPTYDGHAAYAAELATAEAPRTAARADFEALVDELTRRGWSAARIAEHTHRPTRAVTRARTALRTRQQISTAA